MELTRLSNESATSAVQEGTAEAVARADRNAQRVAAAGAALASAEVIDWRSAPRRGSRPTHPTLVQSQQPVAHSSALTSAGAAVGEAPVRGRRSSDYAELKRQVESAGLMGSQRHYFLAKLAPTPSCLVWRWLVCDWQPPTRGGGWRMSCCSPLRSFRSRCSATTSRTCSSCVPADSTRRWGSRCGNLLIGVSRAWWNDDHNAHHARPNVMGSDPNIDICSWPVAPNRPWRGRVGCSGSSATRSACSAHLRSGVFQRAPAEPRYAIRGRPGTARLEVWLLAAHFVLYGGVLLATLGVGGALAFAFLSITS